MGMKFFSDSPERPCLPGDPVPTRFKVLQAELVNGFTIATVEYPDCLPASQLKLLVFRHDVRGILQLVKRLDPHFTDDHPKVVARFRCDPEGAAFALSFAYHYR